MEHDAPHSELVALVHRHHIDDAGQREDVHQAREGTTVPAKKSAQLGVDYRTSYAGLEHACFQVRGVVRTRKYTINSNLTLTVAFEM